ncbi:hypothetical protein [Polymorphobacter arshaanensis]|uniref:hypothetical protein n=1 Tax=Glacieibacterium arshaanense TaxID=2511025 RepID=UPI001A9C5227|nr:hypothetical protein [Polymorphobacter arshaanensis]
MFRVLTTCLSLALLAAPVAAFADDHGKGNNGHHNGKHDNGNHYGYGGNRGNEHSYYGDNDRHDERRDYGGSNRYDAQRYAWQGSTSNAGSWKNYRNYNYNRPAPGQTRYYANQYYRDGRYYQPRYVSSNERIYRGQDNRYYCRRSDGTTGLIIGGLSGGSLGAALAPGGSQTLGALLGGTLGAVIGSSIDKGQVTCR